MAEMGDKQSLANTCGRCIAVTWSLLAPLWNILPCNLFFWILISNVWFLSLMEETTKPSSWGYPVHCQVVFFFFSLKRAFVQNFWWDLFPSTLVSCWWLSRLKIPMFRYFIDLEAALHQWTSMNLQGSLISVTCVKFDFKIGYIFNKCV